MRGRLSALAALALTACATGPSAATKPAPPTDARDIGGATWLIEGSFAAGGSPDGNSLILHGPEGAVVIDTGRHAAHVGAIQRALRQRGTPPVAIINSHWHLDHVSGNLALKATYPGVRVYGTSAIDGALAGFLAASAAASRRALADATLSAAARVGIERDLATIARGAELRPDVIVDEPREMSIAGRRLSLRIARGAVTERDLWIYDGARKRAIVGDLVTLPAPFLDTACPEGWSKALGDVAVSGAEQVVPGHGPVMTMADFDRWRSTFDDFIACARGTGALEGCSTGWLAGAAEFIGTDGKRAKAMADYYGGLIRAGKLDGYCTA